MSRLHDLIHFVLSWLGLSVRYRFELDAEPVREEEFEIGWAARQLELYPVLYHTGCLSVTIWRGWVPYSGKQAAEMVPELIRKHGFFMTGAEASVQTGDGNWHDRPEKVPTGAQIRKLRYQGELPLWP